MGKLVYIKPASTKGYLALTVLDGGETRRFAVSEGVFESIGAPVRGEVLNEEQLSVLKAESERYFAMKKALNILAYADNSEKQLTDKLLRAGFSREVAAQVTKEAVSLGYLNEQRQVADAVLREAKGKLHGPHRILRDLCVKGYRKADVSAAIRSLTEEGELDFSEIFKTLLKKKKVGEDDLDAIRKWRYTYGFDRSDET